MKSFGIPKWYALIFIVFLALDQWVKSTVRFRMYEGEVWPGPFPGIFELKLTYNEGIAFGMAQGRGQLFAPVAIAICLAAAWYMFKNASAPFRVQFPLGLLSAGAIGNLIDRLSAGRVTDMFWLRAINFPVFNIADVCLTFAAILMLWHSLFEKKPNDQELPASSS